MGMSDREAFIDWWESRHYDNEDREVKKASWCAWKAAREQEGGEAVERMSIGRASRAGIRFEDREIYCRGWNDCLESHPPQSQGVPEGYVLAPKSMCITQEDVGLIVMMTGWDDEDQDDAEGVLWFGLIEDDEGNRTHGLNISCSECMEEGAIQLVQFDEPNSTPAAPQADEWVKCSERLPRIGQRVILRSKGVVQNYMPTLDQGDIDGFGGGDGYFWCFDDAIGDEDYPLVDFETDEWMPCPQPPEQGDGV